MWMMAARHARSNADGHRASGAVHDEQRRDREGICEVCRAPAERHQTEICRKRSTSGTESPLARPATPRDKDQALTYLNNDPSRLKGFAWMLFNLDEFVYVQ